MKLTLLAEHYAVCRLPADASVPVIASPAFLSITWTADELSFVCLESAVPESATHCEAGWRILKVAGPLDFSLVGILASIVQPLANAGVSIFTISTFDTDYVLIPEQSLAAATQALESDGHYIET